MHAVRTFIKIFTLFRQQRLVIKILEGIFIGLAVWYLTRDREIPLVHNEPFIENLANFNKTSDLKREVRECYTNKLITYVSNEREIGGSKKGWVVFFYDSLNVKGVFQFDGEQYVNLKSMQKEAEIPVELLSNQHIWIVSNNRIIKRY